MPAHLIAEQGPQQGLLLDLSEGKEWIVGRDPDSSDFVLDDTTVSRKAAQLTKTAEGVFLKNLSRVNPVLVNDEEHEQPILLKEGDRVQIGQTVFAYSEKAIPAGSQKPKKKKKQEKQEKKGSYDNIFGDLEAPSESQPEETDLLESPKEPEAKTGAGPETSPEIPLEPSKPEHSNYDTIFEEGEEQIPFHLATAAPFLLKVVAGPNAGAEIGLEKGRTYTIGKDSNTCEIVFQDLSVSRNHARLSVGSDGTLELEDLGSKNGTVVNGTPLTERKIVTPQDLIALGTTVFFIIDREAPQETIYSPVAPAYEALKSPAEEAPPEIQAPEEIQAPAHWKQQKIPGKQLIAVGSFLLIFFIVFLSFFSLFKSSRIEIAQKEPVSEIKEALAKFHAVQFSFNPGSAKLFLAGHVQTGVDYQEMKYRIGQIPFIAGTEDNVVIDEYVVKTMNDVLNDNAGWRGVSISAPQAGKFVVNGYVLTQADAAKLAEYLTVNFPYLDRLENKVTVEETLNAQLQSLLVAHGFGAVAFQVANGEVVLSGRYSEKMAADYEELVKKINAIHGVASVKNFAVATSPDMAAIDLTQNYQVTGSSMFDGRGYSAILNGKIYTLGDRVDGMKITSIQQNTILLEKDGLKYKIDYAR